MSLQWLRMVVGLTHAAAAPTEQHKVLSAPNLALGDLIGRVAELEERLAELERIVKLK